MNLFLTGTGIRRYTRKHLRHDRDAARAECRQLRGRLERSAQANRELAAKKDAADAKGRDLEQQLEVANGLAEKQAVEIRDLKAGALGLGDSETTANIPRDQLPQQVPAPAA
ncbi:hypothetical protein [Streptomyces sp. NPDC002402]